MINRIPRSLLVSIQRLLSAIMPRIRFAVPNLPQYHFFLLLLLARFTSPQVGLGQETGLVKFQPGRRQLFLDDYAISSVKYLTKTLHQPEKTGAVITPSDPGKSTSCRPVAFLPGAKS